MLRALVKLILAVLVLASAGQAAFAEKRVALVIGNGAYVNAPATSALPEAFLPDKNGRPQL